MSKIFIDTNIIIYSLDSSALAKQRKARAVLRQLEKSGRGVISTQVLQEVYVTITKKLSVPPQQAKQIAHNLQQYEVVIVDGLLIGEAIDCSGMNQISFWDALIVVCAESARCKTIWTEDLNAGQTIRSVKIEHVLTSSPTSGI